MFRGDDTKNTIKKNTWFKRMVKNTNKKREKVYIFALAIEKYRMMKTNLQLITAALLSIGGLVMLFCGIFIDPEGQIHETLLVAFGETATFAGALFGIDYVYKRKE